MVTKNRPTHPGILFNLDVLEPKGMLVQEYDTNQKVITTLMMLTTQMSISVMGLRDVLLGKAPVTLEVAKAFGKYTNTSVESWYDMQVNYDKWELALTAPNSDNEDKKDQLKSIPVTREYANTLVDFRKEVESLINRMSLERGSDTPDFILAEYLTDSLEAFDKAIIRRERWYGRLPNTAEVESQK